MNELNSLPAGLEERIAEANRLLSQSSQAAIDGYRDIALIKAQEGMAVLKQVASMSPEHGAVLLAGVMGHRGIEVTETEENHSVHIAQRKFCGMDVGTKYTPIRSTRSYNRTIRLI